MSVDLNLNCKTDEKKISLDLFITTATNFCRKFTKFLLLRFCSFVVGAIPLKEMLTVITNFEYILTISRIHKPLRV